MPLTERDRLIRAYAERNALVVAFVKMALNLGWNAGRSIDTDPKKRLGPDWRHVLYVDLPTGEQLSWHMSPTELPLLAGMPQYNGRWNGTLIAKKMDWPGLLPMMIATTAMKTASAVIAEAKTNPAKAGKPRDAGADRRKHGSKNFPSQKPGQSDPLKQPPTSQDSSLTQAQSAADLEAQSRAKFKASFWGPRTFRIEEAGSFQAALAWLIRNRHVVIKDAVIEGPEGDRHTYTQAALSELCLKMGGKVQAGAAGHASGADISGKPSNTGGAVGTVGTVNYGRDQNSRLERATRATMLLQNPQAPQSTQFSKDSKAVKSENESPQAQRQTPQNLDPALTKDAQSES